jgi:hypothetical protein
MIDNYVQTTHLSFVWFAKENREIEAANYLVGKNPQYFHPVTYNVDNGILFIKATCSGIRLTIPCESALRSNHTL